MSGIGLVVLIFVLAGGALGVIAYLTYQRKLRRAKAIERGLKMVPILIHLPPPSSDTAAGSRDLREVMREKTSQAEVLYNLISGTATQGFKSNFYGQRHIALELVAIDNLVHFFVAVPVALVSTVTKAIQAAYPGARMEEVEDHNIFNREGRLAATLGGEMVLRAESAYPIATYEKLERDPMEAMLTAISALDKQDGVAVQIMLRPANPNWTKRSEALADMKRKGHKNGLGFSAMDVAKAAIKAPAVRRKEEQERLGGQPLVSNLELAEVTSIEEKTKHPAFEVLVRVLVSTGSVVRSQQLLRDIATAFALFETPGMNGFKFLPALDVQGLVTAFIFRFFPPELKSNILNSAELATLFHLPDSQFTPSKSVERQQSKQVDGPVQLPAHGLLFGHNEFRGVRKEIRLSPEDRRRHTYILGQTGTGKSTMLENLAVQDMLAGNGFAFIDPHGDSAEKLLSMVPKERAEDVVYFNPSDTQYPLGLNLFEFNDPSQKDFIVQETINMLYKLYDPGHTGIIGPRYEHWYRNAALTLMSDPNGATFIEIPKVFTDTDYLKQKFKHLRDPTVIDFWTKEMGQTSDYHKSEMLGWFVSKFGAFQNNEMMRNIIGQTKSAFNIRDVMDKKKILIVNLSKGRIGELNSQLLGMIFVIKFQAAAMSRADMPEDQRSDFALYVDEFQNFSTDSFASILSEARKYRLNLIVANQFIGQLSDQIRDAVFGNIGTIVAHRMGPEDAEFMVKQFAPAFDASDLVNIPNYNAVMRLMIGGLPSQPFTLRDSAPITGANPELGMAVKQLSAAKFGRTKSAVEADILDRMSSHGVEPLPAASSPAPTPPPLPTPASAPVSAANPVLGGLPSVMAPAPVANVAPVAVVAPVVAPASSAPAPMALPPSTPAMNMVPPSLATEPLMPAPPVVNSVPPIGAPPMNVPPIGAPPVELPLANGLTNESGNTAGQPMMASPNIIPEPVLSAEAGRMAQAGGFNQMGRPLPMPGDAPVVDMTPPPIGAPPMNVPPIGAPPVELPSMGAGASVASPLPSPAAAVSGTPQSAAGTLSLSDITGGKRPGYNRAPEQQADVFANTNDLSGIPLIPPGAEPPMPIAPAPAMGAGDPNFGPMGQAVQPEPGPVLGSGQPLPSDPYANIDVLGDLTPPDSLPVPADSRPFVAQSSMTEPMPQAIGSGEPLPGDPYSNIDILGGELLPPPASVPEPVPAAPEAGLPLAAPAMPVADVPAVRAAEPVMEPAPAPVFERQAMVSSTTEAPVAEPVVPSNPAAPLLGSESLTVPQTVSPVSESVMPVQEPISQPILQPLPEPAVMNAAPQPMSAVAPTPVAATVASAPVVAPAPVVPPAPVQPAQQMPVVEAQQDAPTPEEFIHFVDPNAPAVLARPAAPEPDLDESGQPSLNGLPSGVTIIEPMQAQSPAAPVPMTGGPSVAPMKMPLEQMATTPPPIGAKPVELPAAPVPVAPAAPVAPAPVPSEPAEAQVAQVVEAPIPASNTSLAEALVEPVTPVPGNPVEPAVELPMDETAALDKVESVADMLEDSHEKERSPLAPSSGTEPPKVGALVPGSTAAPIEAEVPAEIGKPEAGTVEESVPVAAAAAETKSDVPVSEKAPAPVVETKPEFKPEAATPTEPVEPAAEAVAGAAPAVATTEVELAATPVPERTGAPEPTPESKTEPAPESKHEAPPQIKRLRTEPRLEAEKEDKLLSGAERIEKAERQIDDLLSVSLLHPEVSGGHRRLPEVAAPPKEDETGVDLELNAGRPANGEAPAGTPAHMMAQHHGLKVIQPLEPIVPPREQFAKELAAMQAAAQAPAPVAQSAAENPKGEGELLANKRRLFDLHKKPEAHLDAQLPKPASEPKPAPVNQQEPVPVESKSQMAESKPVAAEPKAALAVTQPEPVAQPQAMETFDEIPQAESLAASDVARARVAQRPAEEPVVMQAASITEELPATPPPPPFMAGEAGSSEVQLPEKPVEDESPRAEAASKPEAEVKPERSERPSDDKPVEERGRKRHRLREKPAEHIESEEEAEHNKPTEAGAEAGAMAGKLILPTGEKPQVAPVLLKQEKPKKLAPGEVYVDERGNVIIGE